MPKTLFRGQSHRFAHRSSLKSSIRRHRNTRPWVRHMLGECRREDHEAVSRRSVTSATAVVLVAALGTAVALGSTAAPVATASIAAAVAAAIAC